MNLNQIGRMDERNNTGPKPRQHGFQVYSTHVAGAEPNDFGRGPLQSELLKEISIFGQNYPAVAPAVIPNQSIGRLLPEISDMQTNAIQLGRQSRRQVFVDQQANHEARATVLCTSLKRRA